ncbi:MAG: YebC/PmpR family DNA-binding transcriptional regulator [Candidatus Pacebacteria bacterium]|nr:YebC/PmpR family DNA-binding transcriptional regulator [Candidatus Paceibacterota bacterium]
MSGHSKWATIKRAKGAKDAKRGAVFTKLSNLITVAARDKGGDPDTNFTLRMAIDKAKAVNMPKDNIDRAIKKGTGELEGAQIEELYYEGIGPANSQFIVKCLTDNKNRSAANVRHLFTKFGGSLASVNWNFEQKSMISFLASQLVELKIAKDDLELELIDAGAQDIKKEDEMIVVVGAMTDLQNLKQVLESKNITTESAEIEYVAKEEISLSEEDRAKVDTFIEALEDDEDVTDFYTNIKF